MNIQTLRGNALFSEGHQELKEDASTDACGERVNQTLLLWQFLTQIYSAEDPTGMAAYSVQQSWHGLGIGQMQNCQHI